MNGVGNSLWFIIPLDTYVILETIFLASLVAGVKV